MKWEIDKNEDADASFLVLDGLYPISFDRLTEEDWFKHLSKKSWVDMRQILPAFIAAYDAAGIPLSRKFFDCYKFAFSCRAEADYEDIIHAVCNDMLYAGEYMWSLSHLSRDSDTCIEEILEEIDGVE